MTTSWSGARRSFPTATAQFILKRDGWQCQLGLPGCTEEATEADHILGHAEAERCGWVLEQIDDAANGQAVCASCHRQKTRVEQERGRARKSRFRQRERHPGLLPDEGREVG